MKKFTLDTNCLIDIADNRPNEIHVKQLLQKSKEGLVKVSILASSASERQLDGTHLENFDLFKNRMQDLGFGHIEILLPIASFNLSFYGHGVWGNEAMVARETKIFGTLFPTWENRWADYAAAHDLDINDLVSPKAWKWRNKRCDAQAYWAHEHSGNDHFVTSDPNFRRKLTINAGFPDASILTPQESVEVATAGES